MAEAPDGFLGRWARRKTDVLQGKPLAEPVASPQLAADKASIDGSVAAISAEPEVVQAPAMSEPAALSLEDVKLLTKDSDFKPFMAQNVGVAVRNAAMKKLFADPHFNVMDGLDIYIDDYSKSDPIPDAMLRQMNSSQFLKLFDDEEDDDKDKQKDALAWENTKNSTDQSAVHPPESTDIAEQDLASRINSSQPESLPKGLDAMASLKDHDDPDLRLQPDHAAPAPDAGRGA